LAVGVHEGAEVTPTGCEVADPLGQCHARPTSLVEDGFAACCCWQGGAAGGAATSLADCWRLGPVGCARAGRHRQAALLGRSSPLGPARPGRARAAPEASLRRCRATRSVLSSWPGRARAAPEASLRRCNLRGGLEGVGVVFAALLGGSQVVCMCCPRCVAAPGARLVRLRVCWRVRKGRVWEGGGEGEANLW